jgi:hypothetical protein
MEKRGEKMILGITNGEPQMFHPVLHEDRTVEEASPNWMLNTSVSCFINSRSDRQGCDDCLRWKKAIPKERRVHSLGALLTACKGGAGGGGGGDTEQGIVFVDVNDATGIERTIDTVRDNARDVKIRVLVFACNVDRLLKEANALLVV